MLTSFRSLASQGPYVPPNGNPDLRNLRLYYATVAPGDLVIAVSDGVHDNLDPEQLGVPPCKIDSELDAKSWDKIPGVTAERLKTSYRTELLRQKIEKLKSKTPKAITAMLMDYCSETTSKSREFMEKNPQTPHPSDYAEYPGKMDHTTAVVFQVPELENSPEGSRKKARRDSAGEGTSTGGDAPAQPPKRAKSDENGSDHADGGASKKKKSTKKDKAKEDTS